VTITLTLTLTLDFTSLFVALIILIGIGYLYIRYRWLTKYSRLPVPQQGKGTPFDLHPDTGEDGNENASNYPDEFLGAFLSSIKIFG